MLVLSRKVGEQVVIDDRWIATIERIDPDAVRLSLANHRGVPLGQVIAALDAGTSLIRDVEVVYIRSEREKVRLGFRCSDGSEAVLRIARKEHWDLLRGRSD